MNFYALPVVYFTTFANSIAVVLQKREPSLIKEKRKDEEE